MSVLTPAVASQPGIPPAVLGASAQSGSPPAVFKAAHQINQTGPVLSEGPVPFPALTKSPDALRRLIAVLLSHLASAHPPHA